MFFINLIRSDLSASEIVLCVVALLIAATLSIVAHEVSHGYVALWNGDPTAKMRNRLTFNPVVHFDVLGVLMLLLCGFGWAKPVPINPGNFKNYRKGVLTVSVAGVSANLILAGFSLLLLFLLYYPMVMTTASGTASIGLLMFFFIVLLQFMVQINFMLALFNLLPIYPLDGFHIVNTLLPDNQRYQQFMVRYGLYILLAIIVIGNIADRFGLWYLDIFGMFAKLISNMITKVEIASISTFLSV